MDWLRDIAELVEQEGAAARVVIVEASGPTPRATGTSMLVTPSLVQGRIGRGALERQAISVARGLLAKLGPRDGGAVWPRQMLEFETGPVLGETTGGRVSLLAEAFGPLEMATLSALRERSPGGQVLWRTVSAGTPPLLGPAAAGDASIARACQRFDNEAGLLVVRVLLTTRDDIVIERLAPRRVPFHVYGTGLVARALVRQLADLPFDVVWVDTEPAHFPADVPRGVTAIAAADTVSVARSASARGGFHAVMTASHDLDLDVSRSIAQAGAFAYLGVIGSQVKRDRLLARLTADGVAQETLARISCPIGLTAIRSKQPAVIAVSIAAEALIVLQGNHAGTKR